MGPFFVHMGFEITHLFQRPSYIECVFSHVGNHHHIDKRDKWRSKLLTIFESNQHNEAVHVLSSSNCEVSFESATSSLASTENKVMSYKVKQLSKTLDICRSPVYLLM